ncbi:MAG TPA: HtaA domain-containing protein [Solirubrobacterales bacterium]
MTERTQPRRARGTKLTAGILAAALFALLAFAPFASAAPDPVASGSATITLNKGFTKYLKTFGIKIQKISPAKLKGQKVTLPVTGGEMDPTNGKGTVNLGGGIQFKAGKKKAKVKALVVNTAKKGLFANVAGKKMKLATVGGYSFARAGFGVSLTIKKLKLTKSAAKQLNKKTGYAKGKPKPFLANKLMGSAKASEEPATVTIVPANNVEFNADNELLKKLNDVEAKVATIAPTTEQGTGKFQMPITGGSIAPNAAAGVVQTGGGLLLSQKLPTSPSTAIETEITLGNFNVDLTAHTISVEVVAHSNAESEGKKPLDLGNLGRSSIADLTLTGATVSADATTRTVTVKGASATLQPISAEVLEGFVKVYQGYYEAGFYLEFCALATPNNCETPAEQEAAKAAAKEAAAKKVEKDHITAGNPLGTFSFTAQTQ